MIISIVTDTILTKEPLAGYPFRTLGLLEGYSRQGIKVQLFLCNRNFTNIRELLWLKELDSNIKVFIIDPQFFYKKLFLNRLLKDYGADIIQFENPEFVVNTADFIIENFDKKIFVLELHDLYYKLAKKRIIFYLTKEALQLVDYTVCFSERDMKILSEDFKEAKSKILYSPIFIDTNKYHFYGPNLNTKNLLFMGNLYHKPNLKTVEFLIDKVVPLLKINVQSFHIHFIGICPKKFLERKSPFYTFHGFIKERGRILKKTRLCISSAFDSYGSRVKLFEYAAFGFPILTTKEGISGAEKLIGVFVVDSREFTDRLIEILPQDKLLLRAGLNNRASVKQYYDTSKVVPGLLSKITRKPKFKTQPSVKPSKQVYLPIWLKEKRYKKEILKKNYIIRKNGFKEIKL